MVAIASNGMKSLDPTSGSSEKWWKYHINFWAT